MSNSIPLDLERPGTFVYTEEMALHGYRLTQFGLSLRKPANRKRFLADEAGYMHEWNLHDDEIAMVRARDWTSLLAAGAHLQAILKIAATLGMNLYDIGAHNAGLTAQEMINICPRRISALPGGAH